MFFRLGGGGPEIAKGAVHTQPHKGGWANMVAGNSRVSSTHKTKSAAQNRGRELAILRKVEHLIHNEDGTIGERNSYGGDPPSRPG